MADHFAHELETKSTSEERVENVKKMPLSQNAHDGQANIGVGADPARQQVRFTCKPDL